MNNSAIPLWASIVIAILAGGASGAIIHVVREIFSERKKIKIAWIDEQLSKLYGPLFFFVTQNRVLLEIIRKLDEAYKLKFVNTNWSENLETQDKTEKEALRTLEVKNDYSQSINSNNQKIEHILNDNIFYLDQDDLEVISDFQTHHLRYNIELDENLKAKLPGKIYFELGDIQVISMEFIQRIQTKFFEKKRSLMKLKGIN